MAATVQPQATAAGQLSCAALISAEPTKAAKAFGTMCDALSNICSLSNLLLDFKAVLAMVLVSFPPKSQSWALQHASNKMCNSQRSARVQSTPTNMAATLRPMCRSTVWLTRASSVPLPTSIHYHTHVKFTAHPTCAGHMWRQVPRVCRRSAITCVQAFSHRSVGSLWHASN